MGEETTLGQTLEQEIDWGNSRKPREHRNGQGYWAHVNGLARGHRGRAMEIEIELNPRVARYALTLG